MRASIIGAAFAASLLATAALAAGATLAPVDGAGSAHAVSPRGLVSDQAGSKATLAIVTQQIPDKGRITLALGVENHGAAAFRLTPSSVDARDGAGRVVRLIGHEQLVTEARNYVITHDVSNAMQAASSVSQSGGGGVVTATANSGAGGGAVGPPPMTGAGEQAHQDASRMARQGGPDDSVARVRMAEAMSFKEASVEPGKTAVTYLVLNPVLADASELVVKVKLGADTHEFHVALKR